MIPCKKIDSISWQKGVLAPLPKPSPNYRRIESSFARLNLYGLKEWNSGKNLTLFPN